MRLIILFLLSIFSVGAFSQDLKSINEGTWKGELAMNDRLFIPCTIDFSIVNGKVEMAIVNADERLNMTLSTEKDSIIALFPESEAFLKFKLAQNNQEINGYWVNPNKKSVVKIPFNAWKSDVIIEMASPTANIAGRWKTTFSPNSKDPESAIGVFEQTAGSIRGTFLTETGDYRYLSGTIGTSKFRLSTFNGSWAFLFEGKVVGDSLYGDFYSGQSYHTNWIAVRDSKAELKDEASLTFQVNDNPFQFEKVVDLKGKPFVYPNKSLKGKVVVFQIMGTWCPNCIDETKLLSQLYQEYHKDGLEIFALSYEVGNDQKAQIKKLKTFQKRLGVPYNILLAGTNSNKLASEQFPMLNGIMSFPTSILIDKSLKIKYIHTGFSGPATGEEYEKLSQKIRFEIEELLKAK
jgi:thiol-disulfide isomerase/thioredoxin